MEKYYIKFNSPEELEQAKQLAESMGYIYFDSKGKTNFLILYDNGISIIGDIYHTEENYIKEGYKELKLFTEGEGVEVSDDLEDWYNRIYLTTLPGKFKRIYICVDGGDEEKYKDGEEFYITNWEYIRKIQKTVKITTTTGEEVETEKQKLKNLGFNIN